MRPIRGDLEATGANRGNVTLGEWTLGPGQVSRWLAVMELGAARTFRIDIGM